MDDLIWQRGDDHLVFSPRSGGRVLSWRHRGRELVHPLTFTEGGLLRVLFAEEQYPGTSFAAPHHVVSQAITDEGFRIHLRHYWNTPNWFMRQAGWTGKANELHLDGLVLDKVVTFLPRWSCLTCEMTVTNIAEDVKYLTPWLHLSFADWPGDRWIVVDGKRQDYNDTDIYWGNHLAEANTSMRLVHAATDGSMHTFFGAATDHLRGMSALLPVPGEFLQSTCELRYHTLDLQPGQQWHANCFLAVTDDAERWNSQAPVELSSTVTDVGATAKDACATSLLDEWLLPEERDAGLMVLSYLDKPPFASSSRYAASHMFAGFHAAEGGACARVMLYAARELKGLEAELAAAPGWSLRFGEQRGGRVRMDLAQHAWVPLELKGPLDFSNADKVAVTLHAADGSTVVLRVPPDARVEPVYPYHARQAPAYLQERYDDLLGPRRGADADEVRAWQGRARGRLRRWLASNAAGPCDLEPRMVERQVGPTCVREKWLVQTEPGIWVPGFLVFPKEGLRGRRPLLYFLHGSGLGKDGFAPDEVPDAKPTQLGHELEHMPYRLAVELGCMVYVPDGRGQGELGETNPAQWTARMEAMGVVNVGLRLWDQMRALDWLIERSDVDAARVGSLGCSGGGQLTYMFAAADERVAASIVSSTNSPLPLKPSLPDGYFHRELVDRNVRIAPAGPPFLSGPPTGMLIAPRPMWIVDGLDDLGTPAEQRPQWRSSHQQGRDQIRTAYDALGCGDRFKDCWLEGGHCAGMTVANAVAWFRRWLSDRDGQA